MKGGPRGRPSPKTGSGAGVGREGGEGASRARDAMSTSDPLLPEGWEDDEALLAELQSALGEGILRDAVPGHRLVRELGVGGQARVFLAERLADGAVVAVKVLELRMLPNSRAARRLERELEVLQRLEHPGIVRVHEGGLTRCWRPYLVEEYLPGGALKRVLPLGAPGPCADLDGALELFARICDAVDHAHKRGVVHRDLKPSNVLLDAEGSPKVADFGIAREIAELVGAVEPVAADTVGFVGSLAYASPEATGAARDVDVRSDVFSLGVLLFELLTGIPVVPHDATLRERVLALERLDDHLPSRVHRLRRRRGLLPAAAPHRLPRELDAVVAEALALDREERYQSAAALAADVRAVVDGRPLLARRLGPMRRAVRFVRRHPTAVASLALAMVATAAFAVQEVGRARERRANYAWALDTLGVLLDQAVAGFERLVGGEAYRGELLRSALDAFETMLQTHPGDPALRLGRARCLLLLGVLHRDEGDPAAALTAYRRALDDLRTLVAVPKVARDARRALSLTLVRIGDVRKEDGDLAAAERHYREALSVDQERAAAAPEDVTALDDLFWSHHRLGHLALMQEDLEGARRAFARLEPLADRIQALDPERAANWNLFFAVQRSWAAWDRLAGRGPARERLARAEAAVRRRVETSPGLWFPRFQLASVLGALAAAEAEEGLLAEALRHAAEARRILVELEGADPSKQEVAALLLRTDLEVLRLQVLLGTEATSVTRESVLARLAEDGSLSRLSALDRVALLGAAERCALALADAGRPGLGARILAAVLEDIGDATTEGDEARLRAVLGDLERRAGLQAGGEEGGNR